MSDEGAKMQQPNELARGVDAEGFFTIRVHTSQGLEKILGVLLTSMDMVKAFYIEQHQKKAENGLAKPTGFLKGIKNRWH